MALKDSFNMMTIQLTDDKTISTVSELDQDTNVESTTDAIYTNETPTSTTPSKEVGDQTNTTTTLSTTEMKTSSEPIGTFSTQTTTTQVTAVQSVDDVEIENSTLVNNDVKNDSQTDVTVVQTDTTTNNEQIQEQVKEIATQDVDVSAINIAIEVWSGNLNSYSF